MFEHAINNAQEIPPNTKQRYRNSDPLSLGKIVRDKVEARGESYLTFPQRALFDRIGIRNATLETDAWGNFIMSGFDYLSARDGLGSACSISTTACGKASAFFPRGGRSSYLRPRQPIQRRRTARCSG